MTLIAQASPAAATASDFTKVVEKIGEILQRVSVLETQMKDNGTLIISVLATAGLATGVIGFFGWKQFKSWLNGYAEKKSQELTKAITAKVDAFIETQIAQLTTVKGQFEDLVTSAEGGVRQIKDAVERAKVAGHTALLWDAGEDVITFKGVNYINFQVNFKTKFPAIPQIFVGECVSGDWIFVKIDEKHTDRFTWAARTLNGQPTNHITRIQWVAISPAPVMEATPTVFAPTPTPAPAAAAPAGKK